jgi:hypothetical protein
MLAQTIPENPIELVRATGPWAVRIKAADGTSANSAVAIAETYCYYQ